jgi:hypothetical protein
MGVLMQIDDVFQYVEDNYGYSKGVILGQARGRDIVKARHIAMFMSVENAGLSYTQSGKVFGKDHTTILHAYHKIRGYIIDGRLDLSTTNYQPKIKHKIKIDEIMDDNLDMLKQKFNRAFSEKPFDTMIELCKLAKRLDQLGKPVDDKPKEV